MKTKYLIITFILTLSFSNSIFAQNVDYTKVGLMKNGNTSQLLYLGDPIAKTTTVLGAPTSITTQYFEMQDATATIYSYNACKLYFINGVLNTYNLADASITAGVNYYTLQVGNQAHITPGPPPAGGKNTLSGFVIIPSVGSVNGLKFSYACRYQVYKGTVPMDIVFVLLFDSNDKLISVATADQ
jgi:hypothetical protein